MANLKIELVINNETKLGKLTIDATLDVADMVAETFKSLYEIPMLQAQHEVFASSVRYTLTLSEEQALDMEDRFKHYGNMVAIKTVGFNNN